MNSLDCIRWYKHAETLVIKSKQRPNHFYFMNCTCAVWEQTWTNQRRSNMSSSDPFKLGRLFSWVPGRVWRTKSRLGSQSMVAFNLVRKMHLARSSSWKAGQTWRRINRLCQVPLRQHCKGKDWKTFCKNHDNVTPCVVPRTKYTCVTLSGMGKHVAQRCTSPPGKCRKSLLAFFRITRLATSYVWRVKRKCKNSNLMHTRRYENGVKRLTTCEYVWTQLNIDERIWTHWTASDGINMRKHL